MELLPFRPGTRPCRRHRTHRRLKKSQRHTLYNAKTTTCSHAKSVNLLYMYVHVRRNRCSQMTPGLNWWMFTYVSHVISHTYVSHVDGFRPERKGSPFDSTRRVYLTVSEQTALTSASEKHRNITVNFQSS